MLLSLLIPLASSLIFSAANSFTDCFLGRCSRTVRGFLDKRRDSQLPRRHGGPSMSTAQNYPVGGPQKTLELQWIFLQRKVLIDEI